MKTILITGATGYLGSKIVNYLSKKKIKFIYLVRKKSKLFRLIKFSKNKKKIINYEKLENIFKKNKIDLILHSATSYGIKDKDISNIIHSNLFLPLKLLDLAKKYKVRRFINTDTILKKNISHYTLSKFQFYEWFKEYSDKIHCCNVKIEHFYGPGDDNSKFVINILHKILQKNNKIKLTKGNQKRDFIFINDVVTAIDKIIKFALKKNKGYSEFQIGTGKSISIKNFVKLLVKICNKKLSILKFGSIPLRKNEPMDIKININKLKKLGWSPQFSLKQGLQETVKFYK